MGEIADMMIDGDMCETCGEILNGHGFPQRCAACRRSEQRNERRKPRRAEAVQPPPTPMTSRDYVGKKTLRALRLAAMTGAGGDYTGAQWGMAPTTFAKLQKRGMVERRSPHNPIHKDRAVITEAGRTLLEQAERNAS